MGFTNFLVAAAAASVAVSAAPVERDASSITLPLKHYANFTSVSNIVAKGRNRIHQINGEAATGVSRRATGPSTNDDVTYVAGISIGGKTWQLIVDTGSSNTWCGAQKACEKTSTGKATGGSAQVSYGSGSFSGSQYTDVVSFAGLSVKSQSISSATSSQGFSGVDGIVGFGPVALTQGTVSNAATVPTFMDNLYKQGSIPVEVLGVSFEPESGSDSSDTNGELTLGGTDSTRYTGSLKYFPKATSGASAPYWGISISKFSYGSTTLATSGSGIVDTGTTLIYIPTAAYNKFLSATGGTTDSSSGLASFTKKPTSNFGITFGSTTFTLTPAQYLVPQAQYAFYGLQSGKYYSWIDDGGSSGVNTIIGQKFLENYYAAFDTTNSRIGFAPSAV